MVHGADAGLGLAEAGAAVEPLVLAGGGDPGAPLPRARAGRPLRLCPGDGARRRARSQDGRDLHRGHRRRQPGRDLHPRDQRARLRGAHRLPVPLPRDRGVRPATTRTSTGFPGTTRASSTSGARDRRSCRNGTRPRPDHRRRRPARRRARPDLPGRGCAHAGTSSTSPLRRSTSCRASFCMRRLGRRGRRGDGPCAGRGGSTSQGRGTSSLRARRSSTSRRTTSSTERRASRTSSRTSRSRSRCTDARSSTGSARSGRAGSSVVFVALRLDGQQLRPDDAASSAPSRTRWRWSTTSAARRPTSGIWRKR